MKKNLFDLNENLEYDMDYIFYNDGVSSCTHDVISKDARDNRFKCTQCFMVFNIKDQKQLLKFKRRVVETFNFEKAESALRKEIKKLKAGEEDEE
ncbi:hypothetical protein [Spiroplasma sp. BIUS-1]|uniref:hypothetical protein n=1 Tax=Spiroplasma sp. BIUS-1 TaxID=216964 RepID=UPI001397EE23|nr:hypothetical protein [Spiroplasma sp. BIUS-1]QHX36671.1 hypothetical protein SBIUS_v1c04180 [Spiroplasma sp. BIUS-1]